MIDDKLPPGTVIICTGSDDKNLIVQISKYCDGYYLGWTINYPELHGEENFEGSLFTTQFYIILEAVVLLKRKIDMMN